MQERAKKKADNLIRWCHRCKHEIPESLETDVCELCGGEVVKINTKEGVQYGKNILRI